MRDVIWPIRKFCYIASPFEIPCLVNTRECRNPKNLYYHPQNFASTRQPGWPQARITNEWDFARLGELTTYNPGTSRYIGNPQPPTPPKIKPAPYRVARITRPTYRCTLLFHRIRLGPELHASFNQFVNTYKNYANISYSILTSTKF